MAPSHNSTGTNARLGFWRTVVVEADEVTAPSSSCRRRSSSSPTWIPEHLDFYGSVEAMNRAYEEFVKNIPFYGFATLCIDHPVVQAMIPRVSTGAS